MTFESLKENLKHVKEIVKEIYIFTHHLDIIKNLEIKSKTTVNNQEKKLLTDAINSLTNQLKTLNNSIPALVQGIGFYKKFSEKESKVKPVQGLVTVDYKPLGSDEKVSLAISDKERKDFLENLSKSNLSINQLKRKFSAEGPIEVVEFGRPNVYAKISNRFFRKYSNDLISKGYFESLNSDLRKMNSQFVLGTYISMMFLTMIISVILSIFLFIFLLFFNLGFTLPFVSIYEGGIMIRIFQTFWIIFAIPAIIGTLFYFYPSSESKSLGSKINQELPFVTVHMSAIATSGIEPVSIFRIILRSQEYRYTNIEFRKLMNLVNFHGKDIVTALRVVSRTSPSAKLRELLDGLATTITSGGSLHDFLDKHSDGLLFDYRIEREKYTKISETMMDIYISIIIAAPMVLLILFVIIGSTGGMLNFLGLPTDVLSLLIILIIALLNIGFLGFLKIQQPRL